MLRAFWIMLLIRALLSWIPSLNGRWSAIVYRLTEPVLQPVQRLIPPIGGFSIAFLIVIVLVSMASNFFAQQAFICRSGLVG